MNDNDAIFDSSHKHRFVLSRRLALDPSQPPGRIVLFVMVNPSTAGAATDDATIRKCLGYTRRWGFDILRVVNLYSWRATDVKELRDAPTHPDNDAHIYSQARRADTVVCAWGARAKILAPYADERISSVLDTLRAATTLSGAPIVCLGHTKSGDPLHPLMTSYALERVPFNG
jgi:hypothetical protein